jgi:hypothetical protein
MFFDLLLQHPSKYPTALAALTIWLLAAAVVVVQAIPEHHLLAVVEQAALERVQHLP